MPDSHADRLARARLSLEGLSVGDALGGFYEMSPINHPRITQRLAPPIQWRYTDDTNMALSIYAILRRYEGMNQEALAQHFGKYFAPERGYGMGARRLLSRIQIGQDWREEAKRIFQGGSLGNGGAMRAAPIGAYFADDLPAVIEAARLATEITHAHPEGIAGGIAVAAAAAIAWQAHGAPKPSRAEFISRILPHIPESQVKQGCLVARDLASDLNVEQLVAALGNGKQVTAMDTVPLVLYMAGEYLDNYEEAIWQTLSCGGDADTTSAMVGGIVALYAGEASIPEKWRQQREPLPNWTFEDET
jgi:ADP-ribosylglycohydrolase